MNDREKKFENLVRDIRFDDRPDYNHRDQLERNLLRALDKQSQHKSQTLKIWRIIMKNNITKLAAAVLIVALLVGIFQIDATHAALKRTTRIVSTSLAGLKAFLLDMKKQKPEPPSAVPPADSNEQEAVFRGHSIMANVYIFSVEAKQGDLQAFFKVENVEWTPTGDDSNTWYAKLDSDGYERLIDLSTTATGVKLTSSPCLIVREGQEGVIGITSSEEQDDVALALVATMSYNNESIDLSLSFLNGQNGFEIPGIKIDKDDAILFWHVTTVSTSNEQNEQDDFYGQDYMLVVVKLKIFPKT